MIIIKDCYIMLEDDLIQIYKDDVHITIHPIRELKVFIHQDNSNNNIAKQDIELLTIRTGHMQMFCDTLEINGKIAWVRRNIEKLNETMEGAF